MSKILFVLLIYQFIIISICLNSFKEKDLYKLKNENNENLISLLKNFTESASYTNVGIRTRNYTDTDEEILNLFTEKNVESIENSYNIDSRLFIKNLIKEEEAIIAYEILHYRTILRHDNGFIGTFFIILILKNKIKIIDIDNNEIITKQLDFSIDSISTFHLQEETNLYLITENKTQIRQLKLTITRNSTIDPTKNESESDKFKLFNKMRIEQDQISIHTFKEDLEAYDISLYYKKNLYHYKWLIEVVNTYSTNFIIHKMIPSFNKGKKTLNLILKNGMIICLNDQLEFVKFINLDKEKPNSSINELKYDLESSPSIILDQTRIFQNYLSFILKNDKTRIHFNSLENPNNTILNCDVGKFIEKEREIRNYVFDTNYQVIYVVLDNFEILILFPNENNDNLKGSNKNNCSLFKSIKSHTRTVQESSEIFSVEVLRKDLLISKFNSLTHELILIELNEDDHNDNKIASNLINLSKFRDKDELFNIKKNEQINTGAILTNLTHNSLLAIKNIHGYFLLVRKNENAVFFLELVHQNNRFKGQEDLGFNFKIPIIFIALLILFFYHYFKNRSSNKDSDEQIKDEMMQNVKRMGNFNKINKKNKLNKDKQYIVNTDADASSENEDNNEVLEKTLQELIKKMKKE